MWWIILAIWVFLLVKPKQKSGSGGFLFFLDKELELRRSQKAFQSHQKEYNEFMIRSKSIKEDVKNEKYERWNALEFDDCC